MKPQKALDLIAAALQVVDLKLRVFEPNGRDLPSSAKKEFAIWVDTGPRTVGDIGFIKNGRLQWDNGDGYTYQDIGDPELLAEWASKRKSLFRTQIFKEEMLLLSKQT